MENVKFIDQNLEKGLYLVSTPIGNLAYFKKIRYYFM
jgi:hypothetical protein